MPIRRRAHVAVRRPRRKQPDGEGRGEGRTVQRVERPATVDSLAADLEALGVRQGETLLTHTSLSALGWVCGGAVAVVLALEQALGDTGTLVMPAQSGGLTDPAGWESPPVPRDWWETIRAETPPFDAVWTPTRAMGAVAEAFRTQPGTLRSEHPTLSFTGRGPAAADLLADHGLVDGLGETSPLARLYAADARVLLLGVGHEHNTCLHLAEYRADYPGRKRVSTGSPLRVDGERRWVRYDDVDIDSDDFGRLGADFDAAAAPGDLLRGTVAAADARLLRLRAAVDFAVTWLPRHRRA